MTEVIYRNDDYEYSLEIKNHHEDKLACAGISAIAWALAGAVSNRCEPDAIIIEDGYVNIQVKERTDKMISDFFFMAFVGLKQIELEYPGTITFA